MKVFKRVVSLLLCCSLLLCSSVFSVAAKTYANQFIGEDSKISYFRITGTNDQVYHVDDFTFSWSGSRFNTTGYVKSSAFDVYNCLIAMEPDSDFIYYLDKNKYYTFVFTSGVQNAGATDIVQPFSDMGVALKDSSGNLVDSNDLSVYAETSQYKLYTITFSPAQLQQIDNIALIQFQYVFKPAVSVDQGVYFRFDFNSTALITEGYPGVDEITEAISDSTDKITGEIQESTDEITGEIENSTGELKDKIDEQTKEQKGMFERLLEGIINGLKALFIPGEVTDPETGEKVDYFTYYFDQWDVWMNDHFGVLYFPFAILFDVLDKILAFSPPANPTITFPGLTIMGQELLKPMAYDFSTIPIPWLENAHSLYLFAVDALIGFWLVKLAYKKLSEIMGSGG